MSNSNRPAALNASPSCSVVTTNVLKQVASGAGKGVISLLQNVCTAANVTKCLTATGEKLEHGIGHRKGCTCAPNKDGTPNKSKDAGTQIHVRFPTLFDDNIKFATHTSSVANWNLAKRESVSKRWKADI